MKRIAFIIAIMASMLFAACGENTKIDIKYDHPERLERMSVRMRELSVPDAAAKVADLVESGS